MGGDPPRPARGMESARPQPAHRRLPALRRAANLCRAARGFHRRGCRCIVNDDGADRCCVLTALPQRPTAAHAAGGEPVEGGRVTAGAGPLKRDYLCCRSAGQLDPGPVLKMPIILHRVLPPSCRSNLLNPIIPHGADGRAICTLTCLALSACGWPQSLIHGKALQAGLPKAPVAIRMLPCIRYLKCSVLDSARLSHSAVSINKHLSHAP